MIDMNRRIPYEIRSVNVDRNSVKIELENGVILNIDSNHNRFNFSFGRVELPLKWGFDRDIETSNTYECHYDVPDDN